MVTKEQNEELTRIGPGTAMGNLMRRYWQVVGVVNEPEGIWPKRVRILGEDLVLFKDRKGRLGLIGETCAHRCASLAYGIPTDEGIRCPYHGWHFDSRGVCLGQPNEPEDSSMKDRVTMPAYPIEELGGLIFAYLGPEPRPLLPRFDGFVVEGAIRMIGRALVPCNWLQTMENSVDQVHTEWLHGNLYEFLKEDVGEKVAISKRHVKIGFSEFEFGIIKRRLLEGQSEDCDDWQVGHPLVFPNMLSVGNGDKAWQNFSFQIRVPMDDTHTMHYWHTTYVPPKGAVIPRHLLDQIPVYDVPFVDANGKYILDMIDAQDIMAWVTQGPIADRTREHLGSMDQGVAMYRQILRRELKKVEQGQDPMGVVRDPERNKMIELPVERDKHHFSDGLASFLPRIHARHSPFADDLVALFSPGSSKENSTGMTMKGTK